MTTRIEELLEEIKKEIPSIKKEKSSINVENYIKKIEEIEHILKKHCPIFKNRNEDK